MFVNVKRLILMLIFANASTSSDVFNQGRQKYAQLVSLSSASSCWQNILLMLNEHCSIDRLDQYQSMIAYQFTLCHLSTMNSDLSDLSTCTNENIQMCLSQLHRHMNAFIAYTEFYPFVQSVCYVLREKSYQSELASRLTFFLNHSQDTIEKLTSSIDLQQQLNRHIHRQQSTQQVILKNAIELKQLARANMDKTQDILTSVIQAARHEYELLKQICALSQTIQTVVRITCTYSFWFYALSMFTIYMMTMPKRTNRARSLLFSGMFIYVLLERYSQMSSIINFYQWRLICWICCFIILIRYAMTYQSRAKIDHEQLARITADLIQTEATFARVSRELHRARSKSRSRSRSARAERVQRPQEKFASPLISQPQPSPLVIYDEDKENHVNSQLLDDENDEDRTYSSPQSKRHYSIFLSRSSNSTRKLLGMKNLQNSMNHHVESDY